MESLWEERTMVYDRMDDRPAFTGIPTFMGVPALPDAEALRREQPDVVIVGAGMEPGGAPGDRQMSTRPGQLCQLHTVLLQDSLRLPSTFLAEWG